MKIGKENCFVSKSRKNLDDSITLVLTYDTVLNELYQILPIPYKHVRKRHRLHSALTSP